MKKVTHYYYLLFILLLNGCSTELHHQTVSSTEIKSYQKTLDQLKTDQTFSNLFQSFNNNLSSFQHSKKNNQTENLYNFDFADVPAEIVETSEVISYTFLVNKNITEQNKFENLTLQINKIDEKYRASIIKYSPPIENGQINYNQLASGLIEKTDFDFSPITNSWYVSGGSCYIDLIFCTETASGTVGSPHEPGSQCKNIRFFISKPVKVVCPDGFGSTGGSSSGGSSGASGSYGYGTNGSPIYGGGGGIPTTSEPQQNSGTSPQNILTNPVTPQVSDISGQYASFMADLKVENTAAHDFLLANPIYKNEAIVFLSKNNYSPQAKNDVKEITVLQMEFVEQQRPTSIILETTKITYYAIENNYLNTNLDDDFFHNIDSMSSQNFIDPVTALNFARLYLGYCATLRAENPTWSKQKIFATATLETLHILLDLAGHVPAFGEVADISNGVIYTIQGQGTDAALSFASAVPIAGWFSAGVKFAKRADGLKFLVVGADNIIHFGPPNSTKFRALCGLLPGDATRQAHHLIPRGSAILNHPVVQRAAKAITNGGFHIDEGINALGVATWRNQPNHQAYNNLIRQKLVDFLAQNPNATPQHCYTFLTNLIQQAKQAIINNPNVHINNLNF